MTEQRNVIIKAYVSLNRMSLKFSLTKNFQIHLIL